MQHENAVDGRPARTAGRATPSATVVGAGVVGLCTALSLQEEGYDTTVVDSGDDRLAASWGNAGWFAPALTTPLPNPAVLQYGIRAVLKSSSPLHVPLNASPATWRWLASFARNCTPNRWRASQSALAGLNASALSALSDLNRMLPSSDAPAEATFLVVLTSASGLKHLTTELTMAKRESPNLTFEVLTANETQRAQPGLGGAVHAGVKIHGQRFVDPTAFVPALKAALTHRGGALVTNARVTEVIAQEQQVTLRGTFGTLISNEVVLATGAALGELAGAHGVRTRVQSGRGYSFTVETDDAVGTPIYFPEQRIACTPLGGRLRVAGMMEFQAQHEPIDRRRVETLVQSLGPLLPTARLHSREDEWVGARPCTADGLPLIGTTRDPHVHVAGGHGMWGVALGPVTGQLLARSIASGRTAPAIRPFNPLR